MNLNIGKYDPCPCGSGKKFKFCCAQKSHSAVADPFAGLLEQGREHHSAGRLREAKNCYDTILTQEPKHAEALHLLGLLAGQSGRLDIALDLIGKAIAINPNQTTFYNNFGLLLLQAERASEAITAFEKSLAMNGSDAAVYLNCGNAYRRMNAPARAAEFYQRAVERRPDYIDAWNNLGTVYLEMKQFENASEVFQKATTLKPDFFEAYYNWGDAYQGLNQLDQAITVLRRACQLRPNSAIAHGRLGRFLRMAGQMDAGLAAYQQVVALAPQLADAHNNLGVALLEMGRLIEAESSLRRALELNPKDAIAAGNLGNALKEQGRYDDAIAAYRIAQSIDPADPEPKYHESLMLLLKGEFAPGWRGAEHRWKCRGFAPGRVERCGMLWDGSDLAGRTILLHAEQGFGDTIQFIRYLPRVMEKAGRVVVECPPELVALLQRSFPRAELIAFGQPLPAYDVHCPLMSLPLHGGGEISDIPVGVPYLYADPTLATAWKSRIEVGGPALKVGLVWAGNPKHRNDRNRSIPFALLAEHLGTLRGVKWVNLQKSDPVGSSNHVAFFKPLFSDIPAELTDFDQTAALISGLDLVVGVDTAVVHLAGALGKPVCVLLPFVPDWRWLLERDNSPWYPTAKLFRQSAPQDWSNAVAGVAREVQRLIT